jgi:hypothetical protein
VPGAVVPTEPGFTIGPEDVLGIFVWREAEVSADVAAARRDDRAAAHPRREGAGLTPTAGGPHQEALRRFIPDPSVTLAGAR